MSQSKLIIIGVALAVLIVPKVAHYQAAQDPYKHYTSDLSPEAEEILKKWRKQIRGMRR